MTNPREEKGTGLPGHSGTDRFTFDIERSALDGSHLVNEVVRDFSWHNIRVTVKDHKTKEPKAILDGINGIVHAGEICALMGPRYACFELHTARLGLHIDN